MTIDDKLKFELDSRIAKVRTSKANRDCIYDVKYRREVNFSFDALLEIIDKKKHK